MELFITCDLLGMFIFFFGLEYSSNNFYRAGLVVINSFNLFLSWKDFISSLILIGRLFGYNVWSDNFDLSELGIHCKARSFC